MINAGQARETLSVPVPQNTDLIGTMVPYRRHIYFACVALALACNFLLGKDMAWDTLNYHLYLGFSALNDRFGQDYFAAGPLAYLNPYAYAPFYAMVRAGLPALAICSLFAVFHSVILWLTFELGIAVCPSRDGRTRGFAGICAIALAFVNPVLMQQIGSCFADITTAELALGGLLLLTGTVLLPRNSKVVYAGLILGTATALKLSNALVAISAIAMLAFLPLDWRGKIRQTILYSISLGVGYVVVSAPWAYRLAKEFGNPLFPSFNNVFRSPEFSTESTASAYRFIPESIGEALWRPFEMIDPVRNVHEELSAPDPRYAILVTLVFVLLVRWGWMRFSRTSAQPTGIEKRESMRVLTALGCVFAVNWVLWLRVSGNSRYVLPMACIAAVVIVGILFRLFEQWQKARNYSLALIFLAQGVQLYLGAEYRWNGVPWGGQWFDVSVPDTLKKESSLYLTFGTQSNSFLAPFLAKGSGFVNLAGGYTLDPQGPNGERVRELVRRFEPNLRIVFLTYRPHESADRSQLLGQIDYALQWYGLRPDLSACDTIVVHGLPPELEIRFQTSLPLEPQNREATYLQTCRVVQDAVDLSALKANQRAADLIFDRLEDACPRLFQPRRLVSVRSGNAWRRVYGATDIVASISNGRVSFSDQIRPHGLIDVGSEFEWAKEPMRLECGKRNGVYFAHVLQPNG